MAESVSANSVLFEGFEYMDGAYSAMLVAEDGRVYTGLCTHDGKHDAALGMYDPQTAKAQVVADMGIATREKGRGRLPQGKIHSRIGQGRDGKIYFATHLSFPLGDINTKYDYPGGHFMVYDPVNAVCQPIVKGPEQEGIITGALDPQRMIMFGLTYPSGFFLVCDTRLGVLNNLGTVTHGTNPCRTMGVDDKGNAYLSRDPGEIVKYDSQTCEIEVLEVRVPHLEFPKEPGSGAGMWRTVVWDAAAHVFYGVHARTSLLFLFDPQERTTKKIGPICAKRDVGNELATFASLAIAQAPNGTIYYVAPGGMFDYFASQPLHAPAHLVTYNPQADEIVDHGEIWSDGPRRLWGSQNAAVSRDGRTLYLFGAVEALSIDKTIPFTVIPIQSDGEVKRVPYQLRLLIIDLEGLAS